ncbi:hypothetical protein HPB51_016985 [Rhipicephalus microplus]|uniref:Uncharacterized protein n=1 Tax=Rhipicephalus microplus TaxID=6941 RepID=A0A9J6F4T8_RHIMP|nr:hypothetical protein HPB51_016985 [Rhipicephalus microplus]
MEEPVEPAIPEKKKRRLLWNIFSRNDDKTIVKEFPLSRSEDSESKAGLLDEESTTRTDQSCFTKGQRGIADSPEFSKVVANIERNINEANNPYSITHKPKVDGAATASQRRASRENKTAKKSASKESSGSSCVVDGATTSGIPSLWNEPTSPLPDEPSPGSSSPMVSRPASSGLSSASRMSLVGSTPPKDADQQYLNEGFLKSNSSWDERSHPDSTTPFQTNKAAEGSVSKSSSQRTTTSKMAASSATRSEEKEIWASPSWSPARNSSAVGEKASQTSLHHYCPQSSGDDHFRASPLVKANLVEVTVINNPPPNDMVAGSSKCCTPGRGRGRGKASELEARGGYEQNDRLRCADGDG